MNDKVNEIGKKWRTKCDSKSRPCCHQIVLGLVVDEAKNSDNEMEEDPDTEEELTASFINHPDIEFGRK